MMRRDFLKTGSLGMAGNLFMSNNISRDSSRKQIAIAPNFYSDGLGLSPKSYIQLLSQLVEENNFKADVYCLGEVIENFEKKIATSLGKEKAIYMPTGTLANHIALRLHCVKRKKALVQQQSHVYRDCGDAIPQLSGIHLVPLSDGNVMFSEAEVDKALHNTSIEKVHSGIEAISIETPVRRQHLRRFDYKTMRNISESARKKGIAMHLDGARIYGESAISGISIVEYADLFDTVYVSLYKYFNSIAGAILAGSAELIDGLHHERRMFGGGLRSAWENVIVADYFFDDFEEKFQIAQKTGKTFLNKLKSTGNFNVNAFDDGTNVYQLFVKSKNPVLFTKKLMEKEIALPAFNKTENCFVIKLNESLVDVDVNELVKFFNESV